LAGKGVEAPWADGAKSLVLLGQAARELSTRAQRKSRLYRQGKTTEVTLVSRRHWTELLGRLMFILTTCIDVQSLQQRDETALSNPFHQQSPWGWEC
jgi:hypothetical protein